MERCSCRAGSVEHALPFAPCEDDRKGRSRFQTGTVGSGKWILSFNGSRGRTLSARDCPGAGYFCVRLDGEPNLSGTHCLWRRWLAAVHDDENKRGYKRTLPAQKCVAARSVSRTPPETVATTTMLIRFCVANDIAENADAEAAGVTAFDFLPLVFLGGVFGGIAFPGDSGSGCSAA